MIERMGKWVWFVIKAINIDKCSHKALAKEEHRHKIENI